MNFKTLENEALNLNTNMKKELMAKMLEAEQHRLENSLVPLNMDHKQVIKEEREQRCLEIIAVSAVVAGAVGLSALAVWKIKKTIEEQMAKEKETLKDWLRNEKDRPGRRVIK